VCDICQSSPAVSLCHEDRAFLCRACDASIHSANEHVAAHSRFLFTNVKLELEAVGASKKRKAAEMNDRDEKPRVSVSGDFAVPSFGYHQLEQRVPDARLHAENSHYDVVADGPNTDPFAAEFLHLDGGDGRRRKTVTRAYSTTRSFSSRRFSTTPAPAPTTSEWCPCFERRRDVRPNARRERPNAVLLLYYITTYDL
jgi:hypothetical protein